MKEDVQHLLTKGKRNLELAGRMCQEGAGDFSVSHAAYAMFHAAEAMLLTKGLRFKSHRAVIGTFAREFVKTGRISPELGRALRLAMRERHKAEYAIGEAIAPGVAEAAVRDAERFVAAVEAELNRGS